MLQAQSHFIPLANTDDKIHIKRFFKDANAKPMFCLHGSIENGRIFYSKDFEKGLAPFFAKNGYDVFVADMRGKGKSTPKISASSKYGMYDCIDKTIPAIVKFIQELKGKTAQTWVAHSWGGNLLNCFLIKKPNFVNVEKAVFFGVKRKITINNPTKWYMLNYGWHFMGKRWLKQFGYLPFGDKKLGGDNEPKLFYEEINDWIKGDWIDKQDGFNYAQKVENINLPKSLWLAGKNDKVLGHPKDVKKTMTETKNAKSEFWLLGKANGFKNNYGHNDMLIHKDCVNDIFPKVLKWLNK